MFFRCQVVSNSLRPHELQQSMLLVLHYLLEFTQTHVHFSSSVIPCSCPQSFPASGSSPVNRLFENISVQFSSVMSDSLWSHGMQDARPPCPSLTSRVYSNSCPLSWWCHPTSSSSVVPFPSCAQSCPASVSFPMSWFFISDGQSIRTSASASVLPMNI